MEADTSVIASGNLASARRIVAGVLGQLSFLAVEPERARQIITNAGLPERALEEPDFPISLGQEQEICAALVAGLPANLSAIRLLFSALPMMGIENLGVIGMAMRHASNAVEALKVCLEYPELTMGHCRMVVRRREEMALFSFHMDRPSLRDADEPAIDALTQYCTVLDLTTSLCNMRDVVGSGEPPFWVTLPYPEPADWQQVADSLDFSVEFNADEACIAYPATFDDTPLPKSNPLIFKMYTSLAEKMSQMLAEDASLDERVTRWLWAYTPPPSRKEVAALLAMSERNLTRQLSRQGTTYSELLARVQSERARNFLRNRDLSVTEIGYRLGYSEPAAFTRAFTAWTGESPLKWRQSHPA